ncbi:MAG TPA: cytochrome b/b6 domain-containing protein [Methylotenera sp.]|jgi:cytochrome b
METLTYRRQKVYDPALRLIHLWNGLAILFLMVTIWLSDLFEKGVGEDTLWQLHIYIGYALVLGIVARLTWGIIGPNHARFSDMWHPAAWWDAIRNLNFQAKPRFGHNTLASGAYLLVYLLLVVMAFTGLGLAAVEHSMGPLNAWIGDMPWLKEVFEEPHELIYNLLIGFVLIHIAALIWHEHKDKTPLAQAMVTGYQYEVDTTTINETQGDSNA